MDWWSASKLEDALARITGGISDIEQATERDVERILRDIPYQPDWTALEIGAGIGRLMKPLSQKFAFVIGIEPSPSYRSLSENYLAETDNTLMYETFPDWWFITPDYRFDFIYSMITFQHIRSVRILADYLRQSYRLLGQDRIFRYQMHDTSDFKFGRWEEGSGVWGNAYLPVELQGLMWAAGFKDVDIQCEAPWIWVTGVKK